MPSQMDGVTALQNIAQSIGKLTGTTSLQVIVDVAHGGTGATTAGGARANLGLGIGINVEAWSANLDVYAGKAAPAGEVVGTIDAQALTNKTISASTLPWSNVTGTPTTAAGYGITNVLLTTNNLSDVANIATARSNLGLGTAATRAASNGALANLASISGAIVAGHIATFADTAGTVQDGGVLGTITTQNYSAASFTPGLAFGGASTGIAYTMNSGYSIQLGALVVCFVSIVLSNKGSATGAATLTGLPVASGGGSFGAGGMVLGYAALATISGAITMQIGASASVATLVQGGAAATAALTDANFTNTSSLNGALIYHI